MYRSEHILRGLGNQYYRATYKSMGFTTEDLKRLLIGIANAWSECVPGHYNLRQVAQRVKDAAFLKKPSWVMGRLYGRSGVIPSSRSNFAIAGVLYPASATSV